VFPSALYGALLSPRPPRGSAASLYINDGSSVYYPLRFCQISPEINQIEGCQEVERTAIQPSSEGGISMGGREIEKDIPSHN